MTETARRRSATILELALLVAVIGWLAVSIVPCHWTSIWMDREFTGWVMPIANRLVDGQRLYADGAHSPMPPLPFVVCRLLFGGAGIWIGESALNFLCQAATVLVLWYGSSARLPSPVPFSAALATVPLFFALPKTIAYDAMAQLFVALGAVAVLRVIDARERGVARLLPLCVCTVGCMLSKQNTGAGLLIGGASAILLFSTARSLVARAAQLTTYLAGTVVVGGIAMLAMLPFADPAGMVVDVFLTGSEPKGGPHRLLGHLRDYGMQLWDVATPARLSLVVAGLVLLAVAVRETSGEARRRSGVDVALLLIGVAAIPVALLAVDAHPGDYGAASLFLVPFSPILGFFPAHLLATGFAIAVATIAVALTTSSGQGAVRDIAILACVTIPAALFHALSVGQFRWTYDNNPLIFVALAALTYALVRASSRLPHGAAVIVLVLFGAMLQFTMWSTTWDLTHRVRECTESWPDVPYLRGARLTPRAAGLHETIRRVRTAAPNPADRVLLLPDDPNVEAWLGRPRPRLSASIVFTDQYWERYVETDFQRLSADPPAVIVIGPEPYWRTFSLAWGRGAFELITRVERDLLPTRYKAPMIQTISMGAETQTMSVYVRREDRP